MSQELEPTPTPPWKPPYGDWFVGVWVTPERAKVTLIPDPDGKLITVFDVSDLLIHQLQFPDGAGKLADQSDASRILARTIATARVDGNCRIDPDGTIVFPAEPQVCNLITYPLHEPTPVPSQTATLIPSHPETISISPNPELDTFYAWCSGALAIAAIAAIASHAFSRRQPRLVVPAPPEPKSPPRPVLPSGRPMEITDAAIDPVTGIQVHYRGKFTHQQPPPQQVVAAAGRFRNIFNDRTGIHGTVDSVTITKNNTLGITMTGISMGADAPDFDAAIASARNAPLTIKIFHQLRRAAFKVLAFDYFHPENNLE